MPLLSPPSELSVTYGPLPPAERWTLLGALTAITASAWLWMLYMAMEMDDMMSGGLAQAWMPPGSSGLWSAHDFWMLFVMWAIMMVAMMTPSAVPTMKMYYTVVRRQFEVRQRFLLWGLFLLGYLSAWTVYSVLITFVQWPMHHWGLLDPMMESRSGLLSGVLLLVAGLYQWSPWKDACLTQCRSPLQFLMARWRGGNFGTWRMGLENGIFCVGCCWALMMVLFALGIMNMLWVAVLTAFVLIEKIIPHSSRLFQSATGTLLVGAGLWILWRTLGIQ